VKTQGSPFVLPSTVFQKPTFLLNRTDLKVDSDGCDEACGERIIRESKQQTTFSNPCGRRVSRQGIADPFDFLLYDEAHFKQPCHQ
jgi:hypothetical protein